MRMRRRDFLWAFAGATVAPLEARTEPTLPTIGYLFPGASTFRPGLTFLAGLNEFGFVDGKSVRIVYRFAEGQYERLPVLAAELVAQKVDVIVAVAQGAYAAKATTSTIPIVFVTGGEPTRFGLVTSLNRPEANVTGTTFLGALTTTKEVELLHELVPGAGTLGFLMNPEMSNAAAETRDAQTSAQALGVTLEIAPARSDSELESAFTNLVAAHAGALVVDSDIFFYSRRDRIVALEARHAIPALYSNRAFADAGGFASYGGSSVEAELQAGRYVGRILKGEKPANLPVVQSTKFEFVINLKTAKALGLEIPPMLLAGADEVIE
jgi:putative tryptophan/tyrosine transport system substrate-binding protein